MKMKKKNYWVGFVDYEMTVGWFKNQDDTDQPKVRKVSEITFTKKQWLVFRGIIDDMFNQHYVEL